MIPHETLSLITSLNMTHIIKHFNVILPIVICCCQDNRGAGVGIAGDPGTVHSEEHHKHHHEENDEGAQVAVTEITRVNGRVKILLLDCL